MINGTPTPAELDSAALQATEFPEYYKNAAETMKNVASLMQKNQALAAQANYELAQKTIDTASQYGAQVADKTAELYSASEKWAGKTYDSAVNKTSDLIEKSVDGYGEATKQASKAIDETWAHVSDESIKVKEALIDRVKELDQQLETATGEAREVLIREYNKTMRYLRNEQEDYSVNTSKLPESLKYPFQEKESLPDTPTPYQNGYSTIDPQTGKSRSDYIPMDIQTGPCIPCRSVEPCCIVKGFIQAREGSGRELRWPITKKGQPTTLLVIAKETAEVINAAGQARDENLVGKIDVQMQGKSCQRGVNNWPVMQSSSGFYGDKAEALSRYAVVKYIALPYEQNDYDMLAPFINNPFIDGKVLVFFYLLGGVTDLITQRFSNNSQFYTYTPKQCGESLSYYPPFKVIPVPYFELSGSVFFTAKFSIRIGSFDVDVDTGGSFKAIYGKDTFEMIKEGPGIARKKPKDHPDKHRTAGEFPGPLGFLSRLMNKGKNFIGGYEPKSDRDLIVDELSSRITFFVAASASGNGIQLLEKNNSPDLNLTIGGGEASISGGIELKLELIELVLKAANVLFPGGGQALLEVRYALAREEAMIGGIFTANVVGVGMFEQIWQLGSENQSRALDITIPAERGFDIDFVPELTARRKARIIGKVEIKAQAGLKVWTVTGRVGAEGTAHTQLLWEWKQEGDQPWQYRFYYEGIVVAYKKYAEINYKAKNKPKNKMSAVLGGASEFLEENTDTGMCERPETVAEALARVEAQYAETSESKGKVPDDFDGKITIAAPSVRNYDVVTPPWKPW
ncbi:hypothetical protein [Neptunomonas phycophila]|uniref:hypothetical protein n=1 Tax=Neptunomonas phycophila TaxID=1572645 RepID=UPI001BEC3504|nr:hypothetical protein [Neptunomonas phycophila]MBT3144145.1 hypothetical protein [Neptunomonas phycophila]